MKRICTILLSFGLGIALLAQEGPLLNIQGTLKTMQGASVPDGLQTITFALFDQAEAGNQLWSETTEVNIVRGLYNHNLGSATPLDPAIFNQQLYLATISNGMELSNRTPMTAAPYVLEILGCKGTVGDVKMSILEPDDFIAENGDCWVLMDGRGINSSDRLAQIKGWQNIPDARGSFIRGYDPTGANDPDRGPNPPVGSFQGDSFGAHTHEVGPSDRESIPTYNYEDNNPFPVQMQRLKAQRRDLDCQNCWSNIWVFENVTPSLEEFSHPFLHQHVVSETGESEETRPKNTSYYTYIRIR